MNNQYNKVIAAISTAMSNSGIGIVRMSGEGSFEIADKIYRGKKEKKLSDQSSHTIHYGHIYDENEMVDEVLVMLMKGPHSYTGEDTVEINCHGGVYVVKRILETLIKYGARPAEPGEFTKRAFLNGRLDLSQAEAVGDIITSQNEYALKSSISQLNGNIKKKISEIRNKIIYHTAFIETALDDPEHISVDGYGEELQVTVNELLEEISHLLSTCNDGRIIKEGIKTVIVGKPNAGKSSLLNVLIGEDRAIVTDIAGTTRDTVKEQISLGGILINLVDTAGIRETDDVVEAMGIRKAKEHLNDADLVIYVVDSSSAIGDEDREIISLLEGKNYIVLLNKSDMEQAITRDELYSNGISKDAHIINFSTKTSDGLEQLTSTIKEIFSLNDVLINDEIVITNSRHKYLLDESLNSIDLALNGIDAGFSEDLVSVDIYNSYISLGKILGKEIEDDLADRIFEKFCMGK